MANSKRLYLIASQLSLILGIGATWVLVESAVNGWSAWWPVALASPMALVLTAAWVLSGDDPLQIKEDETRT